MTATIRTHSPVFHSDGTISYWSRLYNRWYHRVHPLKVPRQIVGEWDKEHFDKWAALVPLRKKEFWG